MYDYKMDLRLDMSVFDSVVNEWCYAEGDYRTFCKTYNKAKESREYWKNPTKWDSDYWTKSRAADAAWYAMRNVCDLVGLNVSAVVAVFKSIRRNAQYQNGWNHEARFAYNRFYEFDGKRTGSVESFCDLCRAQ